MLEQNVSWELNICICICICGQQCRLWVKKLWNIYITTTESNRSGWNVVVYRSWSKSFIISYYKNRQRLQICWDKKKFFCRVNTVVPKVSPTHNNVTYLSYVVVICKVTAVGVKLKKINATVGLGRRRKKKYMYQWMTVSAHTFKYMLILAYLYV